jgi:ribosomal-protein-alanine N-acetyltransferase
LVAEVEGSLRGFVSWLELPTGEIEILNLAVDPAFRRRGLATELLRGLIACRPAAIYLEVRQSNSAARELYKSLGFKNLSIRAAYYHHPAEAAVVMKWSS